MTTTTAERSDPATRRALPENWTFGIGGPGDLAQIADLVNAAYRGEGGSAGWTSEVDMVRGPRTTMELLRKQLAESPDAAILLLRESAELLACVRVERTRGAVRD